MNFKQFFINKLILFFTLTTLILVAIIIIGSAVDPEARFGYRELLAPLEYAGLCVLPSLVTWSRVELSRKEQLFRLGLELVLLEALMLGVAFLSPGIDTGRPLVVALLAGSVLVIFLLAHGFFHLKNAAEARRMTQDLQKLQKQYE